MTIKSTNRKIVKNHGLKWFLDFIKKVVIYVPPGWTNCSGYTCNFILVQGNSYIIYKVNY